MSRVFALPPGADFPRELVTGLIARHGQGAPEDLARVTLWLNTARMQRRVREELEARGARLLPRMRLVADLATLPLPGLPQPVPALRRRLELRQLVAQLLAAEPDFAPGTGAAALAESLARLMDEMQMEGVPPEALDAPGLAENHAAHWDRSLRFIRIVARYFEPEAPPDAGARQRRAAEVLARLWAAQPPEGPVIVAGSTASRGATRLFMETVARLPQGALVLPGFDATMPAPVWQSLTTGPVPAEDHPQYRFAALLSALGLSPAEVPGWTDAAPPAPGRNRLISLALRPAPVTDQWLTEGAALPDLVAATADVTLIEAADPRAEATALALILREAAEEGTRAALITPDRMLTRRVAAQLDRWGIRPDDSGGQPLHLTPPGRFLRQVAALMGRPLTVEALLALLKHPLAATGGGDRGEHLRLTRDLELHLRRHGPAFPDAASLADWAARQRSDLAAPWAAWLGAALPPLEDREEWPLAAQLARFRAAVEALAAGPAGTAGASELWREAAGQEALRVVEALAAEADAGGPLPAEGFADLLANLLSAGSARSAETPHPRIAIWGTLEARVQGAGLVLLAGLNDGIWPESPPPDPWLSRQMRLKAGLTLPERRIGLSAHDFQQAAGAPRVVLSRARRDAEAETVPSRWLNRLVNLTEGLPGRSGPEALREMRGRGAVWLARAAALDRPAVEMPAAPRPAPRPPVAARPRQLPVTAITTLVRDPYAVYARHVLRLYPLDPIRPSADARERGTTLHAIVEAFLREAPEAETVAEAEARLIAVTERVLAAEVAWPAARRFWRARIAKIAGRLMRDEARRRLLGAPMVIEDRGGVDLAGLPFRLTAKPDRIDLTPAGEAVIYDYKSGAPPSPKQQKLFDKQLFLEAAMAERGGFPALGPVPVAGAAYIQLGGEGAEFAVDLGDGAVGKVWEGLHRLIARYMDPAQGYAARRAPFREAEAGDYDHLARFGEWDMADPPQPEDVG
jgi:ATP-dependent helicase/nuclease subunit B